MGSALKGIGNAGLGLFTGGLAGEGSMGWGGTMQGKGGLAKSLGLDGAQGEYFNPTTANAGLEQLNAENAMITGKGYQQRLSDVQSGKMSLADAQAGLKGAQLEDFNTQGITGSRVAADEVRNNPLLANLYGEGGLQGRLTSEEQNLASRGYSLQQPDYEAYGQASGDIARQFGQQEQDTTKALARRGLGGTSSGSAGAAFSGLAGNKNEMLAKAQTDIAQKRMADTTQRLQSTRAMMGQLGAQGASLQDDQYNRQLSGAKNRQQNVINAAQLQSGANASNNAAALESQKDKRGAKGKTLMEGLGQGLFSSAQQTGAAPGTFVSGVAGAGGSAAGGAMMASDERNKENVRDGSGEIEGFLDSLGANKYEYTPDARGLSGAGEGEHYSPMAQELEQTPVGASMVQDTPDGKQVDYGKGFGALASGLGELNDRLKRLEGRA